jgi:SAM-dependent methyltransferase
MRYKAAGLEVRSENAAKPSTSAGRWVLSWIETLPREVRALDLGCGKLRYTKPLAERVISVTAVDSPVQINRKQRLFGRTSSVREYAAKSLPNVRIRTTQDRDWRRDRYDVVVCTNVLSAIPCRKTRIGLVRQAARLLSRSGRFLLTTQYRNSHFRLWESDARARPYLDGFIVNGRRGASFYALLDAEDLKDLCATKEIKVLSSGHVGELAYVLACRRRRSQTRRIRKSPPRNIKAIRSAKG